MQTWPSEPWDWILSGRKIKLKIDWIHIFGEETTTTTSFKESLPLQIAAGTWKTVSAQNGRIWHLTANMIDAQQTVSHSRSAQLERVCVCSGSLGPAWYSIRIDFTWIFSYSIDILVISKYDCTHTPTDISPHIKCKWRILVSCPYGECSSERCHWHKSDHICGVCGTHYGNALQHCKTTTQVATLYWLNSISFANNGSTARVRVGER